MREFILLILLLLVNINGVSAARPSINVWHKVNIVTGADTVLTFRMPEIPEEKKYLKDGINTRVYQSRNLFCIFGLVCSDFSSEKEMLKPEYRGKLMEILVAGSVPKEIYGKLVYKKLISSQPFDYEIKYTVEYDGEEWTYIKHFVISGAHLFQFSVGGRSKNHMELEINSKQFFLSLDFND